MNDDHKYRETHATWNALADWYEGQFMHFSAYDEAYDHWITSLSATHAKALDLGTGPGIIPFYALKKGCLLDWTIVDVAPAMLLRAMTYLPDARCVECDVMHFVAQKETFATVTAGFIWPYLPPESNHSLLQSIHGWLIAQGSLLLSFVEGEENNQIWGTNAMGMRSVFHVHKSTDVLKQLDEVGFEVEFIHRAPYEKSGVEEIHITIIARKR